MDNIDKKRKERKNKNNKSNNVGIIIISPLLTCLIFDWGLDGLGILSFIGLVLTLGLGIFYRFNNEKMESFSESIFSFFNKKDD